MNNTNDNADTLLAKKFTPSSRYTVFIPIVAKSTPAASQAKDDTELLKIFAQSVHGFEDKAELEKKALEKDWPIIAVALRQTGSALFQAACAAISAVRTLSIKKPKFAFYQFLRPQVWLDSLRLYAAGHRGPSEGGSAQLGLALVLLMAATRARSHNIIATGKLSTQCNRVYDAKVCAVGQTQEKLQLVLQQAKTGQLPQARQDESALIFFTPKKCDVNGTMVDIADLPEVQELSFYRIRIEPIEWLSEATKILAVHTTRYHLYDRLLQMLLLSIATILIAATTWISWVRTELPMNFLPATVSSSPAEPFESCFAQHNEYSPITLQKDGITPSISSQSTLGWKLSINQRSVLDRKLVTLFNYEGYHMAMIMLSEFSPAKVIIPTHEHSNMPLRLKPGDTMAWGWKLNSQIEANRLIILSQRHRPFNADQLRSEIITRFPQAAGTSNQYTGLDITAAGNYLISNYTGSLSFQFLTTDKKSACPIVNEVK